MRARPVLTALAALVSAAALSGAADVKVGDPAPDFELEELKVPKKGS